MSKVWLSEMSYLEVAERLERAPLAVLPVGSTEQHGPHMPLDVDTRIAASMCEAAARLVADEVGVVIAPPMPFGISAHHLRFPGTVSVDAPTFVAAVTQVGASLVGHGFRRLVILNGHAGNAGALQLIATDLRLVHGAERVVFGSEWTFAREAFEQVRESGPGGVGHACEFETSMYLHLDEGAVRMDRAVRELGVEEVPGTLVDLFQGGPISIALGDDFTDSGVLGDATLGTAAKGRVAFEAAVERLARLFRDVATG